MLVTKQDYPALQWEKNMEKGNKTFSSNKTNNINNNDKSVASKQLSKHNPLRFLWVVVGLIAIALGAIGTVLPVLPTTPFLLLGAFCLSKGSTRFHSWFISTKLYKKYLEDFISHRSMTLKSKIILQAFAATMMIIAIILVDSIFVRVFLVCMIIFMFTYFATRIKTIPDHSKQRLEVEE